MGTDPAAPLPEDLVKLGRSESFKLLLEAQAEEAVDRVIRRRLELVRWIALIVVALIGWKFWSFSGYEERLLKYEERVQARMERMEKSLSLAEGIRRDSELARAAAQKLLAEIQDNTETANEAAGKAKEAAGDALAGEATLRRYQREAIAASKAADEAKAATEKARAATEAARDSAVMAQGHLEDSVAKVQPTIKKVDDARKELDAIKSVQTELLRARAVQLVLLHAREEKTVRLPNPERPLSSETDEPRFYDLTFLASDLHKDSIRLEVKVRGAGLKAVNTQVIDWDATSKFVRPRPIDHVPFCAFLDFRYHLWPYRDFVNLRVVPKEDGSCPPGPEPEPNPGRQ